MSENLKQVEMAKETLTVFERHGEDMSDVRHVIHYFYGGRFVELEQQLIKQGYSTRLTANDDGVVAESNEAIGEEWRTTTLRDLCQLADLYGVEYDGWEASMTRQEANSATPPAKTNEPSWISKIFGKKK